MQELNVSGGTLRQRLAAVLLAQCQPRYDRLLAERRRALLGPLRGDVLEIGPGLGANLPYYSPDVRWVGIEPNPFMHPRLRAAAQQRGGPTEYRVGRAEALPVADASVDAVVGTLVLCSVSDVAAALREVRRVLKPGGRFVFVEHVAAPRGTLLRAVQRLGRPITKFLGDGCHVDRETWRFIEGAGFTEVALEHFRLPMPLNGPHIAGWAFQG
jgi:ubiquinone/menaquinone biosynthesis C-methylase UbiE